MEAVGILANVIAVADLSVKLGIVCGEYISKARNAKEDIRKLKEEGDALARIIGQVQELLENKKVERSHRRQLKASAKFCDNVVQCQNMLDDLTTRLDPGKNPSRMRMIGKSLKWPFTSNEVSENIISLRNWRDCFLAALQVDHMHLALQREMIEDIKSLPSAPGAAFDSYDNDSVRLCHPDTRQELLRDILEWADDPNGRCILWLRGPAGTGKSTISRTVAKMFADRGQLAASFFFNRIREGRNTDRLFVTTIARQIAGRVPKLKNMILEAIKEDQDLPDRSLEVQFSELILKPLNCIALSGSTVPTLILVVDALDECDSEHRSELDGSRDSSRLIVNILSRLARISSVKARIFLTSRPEVPIRLGFLEDVPTGSHQDVALHDIPQPIIEHDIRTFIMTELETIRVSHAIAQDWPGEGVVTQLVKASVPLFIYASTICKFINDNRRRFRPQAQLDKVLRQNQGFRSGIEVTYSPILNQLLEGLPDFERRELLAQFRQVVGTIILLADPLSITSLGELLCLNKEDIRYLLNGLHSVLEVPGDDQPERSIRLFHLSFREYLLQPLDGKNTFWIDEKSRHKDLFVCCLQVMSNQSGVGLRNDICQVDDPGVLRNDVSRDKIHQYIPRSLEYACRYWVMHLRESGSKIHIQDAHNIHDFLTQYLLSWLEAMSWLGRLQQISGDLLVLEGMLSSLEGSTASDILSFLKDARRFHSENQYIISLAPCQVYVSALMFAPKASLVKQKFQCEIPDWIVKMPEVPEDWDFRRRTLHQYKLPIRAVAWSHDGQYIAIATDSEIDVWNASSGLLLESNRRPWWHMNCLIFTQRNTIAVGSSWGPILLWDWVTGSETSFTIGDKINSVLHLSAATTGEVVCVLGGGIVHLMSETFDIIHTWQTFLDFDVSKSRWAQFSQNGKFIALVDNEQLNSIGVYDTHSATFIQRLSAPEGQTFFHVTTSDKGLVFATFGEFDTFQDFHSDGMLNRDGFAMQALVWDLNKLNGPTSHAPPRILSSAPYQRPTISQHGILAWTERDSTIKTWDLLNDSPELPHSLELKFVKCISFSPDGQYIIVGSDPVQIVSVSDLGTYRDATSCTDDSADSVGLRNRYLSPDGSCLAGVSTRGQVTLWHTINNKNEMNSKLKIVETPWDITNQIRHDFALAWSSDGAFLAVGSFLGFVVYEWSAHPPVVLQAASYEYEYAGSSPADDARELKFSPCGRFIAMADRDTQMRVSLWNFPSCTILWSKTFQAPEGCRPAIRIDFRPGGAQLAVCHGYIARLVDSSTGATIWTRTFAPLDMLYVLKMAFDSSGALMALQGPLSDGKPSEPQRDSGQSADSEQTCLDKPARSVAFAPRRLLLINVSDGENIATICMSEDPLFDEGSVFRHMVFTLGDEVIISNFWTIEIARHESRNRIAHHGHCNLMIQKDSHGEQWVTKCGRRLIYCPVSIRYEPFSRVRGLGMFPHRLYGYDRARAAPFMIELTCVPCTS